jgi:hypothetical protein
MTKHELTAIETLGDEVRAQRKELHDYHVEVMQLVTRCESCREKMAALSVDFYGVAGDKDKKPGALGMVLELWRTRRRMVHALRGTWALAVALAGAIAAGLVKRLI